MKKTIIAVLSIIILFFLAIVISYKIVNRGKINKDENINDSNNVSIYMNNANSKSEIKKDEEKFEEINKDSVVAQEILEFLPKSFQTYPGKLNEDYILYEALKRLSSDEKTTHIDINGMVAYKYSDVDNKIKEIYGKEALATKKEIYESPVEYFKNQDAYSIYPVGIDNTDNMMVIKSVEESDKAYKVTVYSVCVYMDMENDSNVKLYLVTKNTIRKYYQLVSRNDDSIKDTYKEFSLEGNELNPNDIVEKYGDYLPIIEYYLVKTEDSENKYYVSDIKDIY